MFQAWILIIHLICCKLAAMTDLCVGFGILTARHHADASQTILHRCHEARHAAGRSAEFAADIRKPSLETGSCLTGGASAASGCFSQFPQRTREKSLVAMCSEIRRNPPDISKGILQNSISRFESWHPSGPVRSLRGMSATQKSARHFRELAERCRVSRAKFPGIQAAGNEFRAPVSGRDFSISKFCCLRLGSKTLRPVVPDPREALNNGRPLLQRKLT
jgi:hypothetical protein